MVKDDTILLLGGLGTLGYFLYKSNFFRGLGDVSTGIGEGVSGIGQGLSEVATGLSSPFLVIREGGENIAAIIKALGQTRSESIYREAGQDAAIDEQAFKLSQDEISKIQADSDTEAVEQEAKRRSLRQDELTQWTKRLTSVDDKVIGAVSRSVKKAADSYTKKVEFTKKVVTFPLTMAKSSLKKQTDLVKKIGSAAKGLYSKITSKLSSLKRK